MAALYPNGLGGTVDELALNEPFYGLDCVAWYVCSVNGVDAVSPAGRDREAPLATLQQAVTNASANDVIVLLDGHEETITAAVAIAKRGLVIVGCGQTSGEPNVELTNNSAAASLLTVSVANVQLRNVRIVENAQANSAARIAVTGAGFIMSGCQVDAGEFDDGAAVSLGAGADYALIEDTTFASTAISLATRPESGLKTVAAVAGLRLRGVVATDGSYGWTNGYALDLNGGAVTDLLADSVSLLLGASMRLGSSCTGYVIPTATGGGIVDL